MLAVKPSIAVLLAAYNGMAWIEEQLASIQAQQHVRVTLFISVDESSDGTQSWCERYAQQHFNVHVLPKPGRLGGAAKNFFRLFKDVDLAPFDLIALADQDDRWHTDKLQRAAECLLSSQHDAYSSNVTAFWPNGRHQLLDKAQPQVAHDYLFEAAGPGCTYVLKAGLANEFKSCLLAKWSMVQAVTLHDWFLYAFARSQGFSWYIDPRPGLDYRQHASNQVGANVGVKSLWLRLHRIRNGWWFGQVNMIASLLGHPWPLLGNRSTPSPGVLIALAFQAGQCRRRKRDQWLFRIVCILTALPGRVKP